MSKADLGPAYALDYVVREAYSSMRVTPEYKEGDRVRWIASDFHSLESNVALDMVVTDSLPSIARLTGRHEEIADALTDWRKALPFTDSERARLIEEKHKLDIEEKLATVVRSTVGPETVVDAGIETTISGRHLMQTWWNWRRDVGPRFERNKGEPRAFRALWGAHLALREIIDTERS